MNLCTLSHFSGTYDGENDLAYSPDHDGLIQGAREQEHVIVGEVQRVDVPDKNEVMLIVWFY